MKATKRTKFINEMDSIGENVTVKKPFKIEEQDKRKFIRIEISSPMSLQTLKDTHGGFWPDGNSRIVAGQILNLSGSGVLVDLDEAIAENDVVAMRFMLHDTAPVNNILGLVKRIDVNEEGCLAGIEFITRKRLVDIFSNGEIELLPESFVHFTDSVRQTMNDYVTTQG